MVDSKGWEWGKANKLPLLKPSDDCYYFVSKWRSELISGANEKEKRAIDLLDKLQSIFEAVENNTPILNEKIIECNSSLTSIKDASGEIIATVHEVAKGASEQAESFSNIKEMISDADEKIIETSRISKQLSDISIKTTQIVSEGSDSIIEMSKHMDIINNAMKFFNH